MLAELHASGVTFDAVVGCSVGALNGARYAATADGASITALEQLWLSLRTGDIFPISPLQMLRGVVHRPHTISDHRLRDVISSTLPVANIEDTKLPLAVVTTEVLSGRSQVWRNGPAVDILAASAALPGIYPPVQLSDGNMHFDGGIASAAPVFTAEHVFDADEIWLLDALGRPKQDGHRTAREVLNTAFIHALRSNARSEIAKIEVGKLHHLEIPGRLHAVDSANFAHTENLIAAGRESARVHLDRSR
jgi:NTE family protein